MEKEGENENKEVQGAAGGAPSSEGSTEQGFPSNNVEKLEMPVDLEGGFTDEEWGQLVRNYYRAMQKNDPNLEKLPEILKEGDDIQKRLKLADKYGLPCDDIKYELFQFWCKIGIFN